MRTPSLVSLALVLSACGDGMSADGQPGKGRPGGAVVHCETLPGDAYCDALEVCCEGQSCTYYSGGDTYPCEGAQDCDRAAQVWVEDHCDF